jgi:hypothetical protein
MKRQNPATQNRHRGTVYIVVLATMSIVLTLTLSGLINARTELASATRTEEETTARSCARSALEIALATIEADPTWREKVSGGVLLSNVSMGNTRFRVTVEDPDDADLLDDYSDPAVITAIAQNGQSTQKYAIRLKWSQTQESDPNLVLDMHPLAYWPMHGLDGNKSLDLRAVRDADHVGTLTYNTSDATGNYDMPQLSTVDKTYFSVNHETCFETDYGSVSFWMQPSSTYASSALTQVAFAKYDWADYNAVLPVVLCMNGSVFLVLEYQGRVDYANLGSISGDTWHHIAITWGDDGWRGYLDGSGTKVITTPRGLGRAWTPIANTADIMFGASVDLYRRMGAGRDLDNHFNGKICEAAFFAYRLSNAQINDLASATPTPRPLILDHDSFSRVVD